MKTENEKTGSPLELTAGPDNGLPVLYWKGSECIAELFRDAAGAAHGIDAVLCPEPVKRKRFRRKAPDQPDFHQGFDWHFRFFEMGRDVCFRDQTLVEDSGYRGGDIHEHRVAFFDALSLLPEDFIMGPEGADDA